MASRGRGAAQRGARFERAVVGWLRDQWGLRAERIRSGRSTDAGDIAWPDSDWLLDCKSQDRWSVLAWFAVRVAPLPPCPACNDDGVLSTLDGDTIGPCPECAL